MPWWRNFYKRRLSATLSLVARGVTRRHDESSTLGRNWKNGGIGGTRHRDN